MANNTTKHKSMSYTKFGYVFIAPFVIAYCIFSLYPLLTTFVYTGSNMTTITANFWGFSNKEVYYDEFLDLTKYYSDNFESAIGTSTQEYMKLRNFFLAQQAADQNDPLNKDGITALINNTDLSQSTRDQLQQALDNNDMSYLSSEAASELKTWKSGYKDLELTVIGSIGSINNKVYTSEVVYCFHNIIYIRTASYGNALRRGDVSDNAYPGRAYACK